MSKKYINDTALLIGLQRNESAALSVIYEMYSHTFIKWVQQRGGLTNDAEDAFQEGVLVLFQKSQDAEFRLTASIGTFLFGVCKRLWMKKTQSSSYNNTVLVEDFFEENEADNYDFDIESFKENERLYQKMYDALSTLGEPCQSLLKSFYFDNKSMQQIAEMYQYTNAENAKTQKFKCLTRLKKIFNMSDVKNNK